MTIIHIVLFKVKSSLGEATVQEVCTRMLNLKSECIHPATQRPYIVRSSGGKDNSPEGLQVIITIPFLSSPSPSFIHALHFALSSSGPFSLCKDCKSQLCRSPQADPKCIEKGGFTHGFVVEFESKADRDYYVSEDKAHREFVEWVSGHGYAEEVRAVDYEAGVF